MPDFRIRAGMMGGEVHEGVITDAPSPDAAIDFLVKMLAVEAWKIVRKQLAQGGVPYGVKVTLYGLERRLREGMKVEWVREER